MRASSAATALISFRGMCPSRGGRICPQLGRVKSPPARGAKKEGGPGARLLADRLKSLTLEVRDHVDERVPAQRVIQLRVGVAVAEHRPYVCEPYQGRRLVEHVVDAQARRHVSAEGIG